MRRVCCNRNRDATTVGLLNGSTDGCGCTVRSTYSLYEKEHNKYTCTALVQLYFFLT